MGKGTWKIMHETVPKIVVNLSSWWGALPSVTVSLRRNVWHSWLLGLSKSGLAALAFTVSQTAIHAKEQSVITCDFKFRVWQRETCRVRLGLTLPVWKSREKTEMFLLGNTQVKSFRFWQCIDPKYGHNSSRRTQQTWKAAWIPSGRMQGQLSYNNSLTSFHMLISL